MYINPLNSQSSCANSLQDGGCQLVSASSNGRELSVDIEIGGQWYPQECLPGRQCCLSLFVFCFVYPFIHQLNRLTSFYYSFRTHHSVPVVNLCVNVRGAAVCVCVCARRHARLCVFISILRFINIYFLNMCSWQNILTRSLYCYGDTHYNIHRYLYRGCVFVGVRAHLRLYIPSFNI